eukprot:jgi/Botrbrau1/437/Bobra.110_2s0087.2
MGDTSVGQKRPRASGQNGEVQTSPALNQTRWKVELSSSSSCEEQYGGTRCYETSYQRADQIGEGTYGQVYLATDLLDGSPVALKKIRMDNEKEGFPITAVREIKLLKMLDHENVIRLREIVRSNGTKDNQFKGSIYMAFDYMDHDLTGLMERQNHKFTLPQIKCYMKQLLQGLNFCHRNGVLHRDLKASNLLINNNGQLKLADFGLARPYRQSHEGRFTNRVITLWYRPPELLLGSERYGPEIDMWSVGCILAELLLGKPIFPGKDETDQLDLIMKLLGSPNEDNMPGCTKLPHYKLLNHQYKKNKLREHFSKAPSNLVDEHALDLLEKLLCLDPKKRTSALDAIGHSFFWADPQPCKPEELPRHQPSHEFDMKKLRADQKAAKANAANAGHGSEYHPDKKSRYQAGHHGGRGTGPPQPGGPSYGGPPPQRGPPVQAYQQVGRAPPVPAGGDRHQPPHPHGPGRTHPPQGAPPALGPPPPREPYAAGSWDRSSHAAPRHGYDGGGYPMGPSQGGRGGPHPPPRGPPHGPPGHYPPAGPPQRYGAPPAGVPPSGGAPGYPPGRGYTGFAPRGSHGYNQYQRPPGGGNMRDRGGPPPQGQYPRSGSGHQGPPPNWSNQRR